MEHSAGYRVDRYMMGVDLCVGSPGLHCTERRGVEVNITAASLDIVHSPAGTPRRPDKWPDPGDHLQLCSPDQKLNTFITNDPRCRDMGRPAPQPKCKTHSEMCLVIDNTPNCW